MSNLPTYDQLPIDPKHPAHTAWGVWGEEDNLGTLNLLTAERVAEVRLPLYCILLLGLTRFCLY